MPKLPPYVEKGALSNRPQPVLTVGGLTLRPWEQGDTRVVIDAFTDPDIERWHRRRIDNETEALEWIDQWGQRWKADTAACWAVCDSESGNVVGRMALSKVNLHEGVGILGYWVMPLARGRGVAPSALAALTCWAFDDLGLKRLELAHSVRNMPSCRVAEKAGYAYEGTLTSALRHADGWHDMHLHAVVR